MATQSSILAWGIPWTEELALHGVSKETLVTKQQQYFQHNWRCTQKFASVIVHCSIIHSRENWNHPPLFLRQHFLFLLHLI